jgi:hypothetical protein
MDLNDPPMGTVYRLDVWRELRATLTELAEVGALELELACGHRDDTGLAVDCRRWRRLREARVRRLGARLTA